MKYSPLLLGTIFATTSLTLLGTTVSISDSAEAIPKNCQWLKEINTQQTHVRKITQTTVIFGDNWNTDFAVPPGKIFKTYTAQMKPENEADYEIAIHLKYNDGTSDTVYQRNIPMKQSQIYSWPFQSPTMRQPYQINLNVGGKNNQAYVISMMACQ